MEVNGSGKHSSFLQCGSNYGCKKSYSTGSWSLIQLGAITYISKMAFKVGPISSLLQETKHEQNLAHCPQAKMPTSLTRLYLPWLLGHRENKRNNTLEHHVFWIIICHRGHYRKGIQILYSSFVILSETNSENLVIFLQ